MTFHSGVNIDPVTIFKQNAADHVLTFIRSGMVVGLGGGSTARLAVQGLAKKISLGELIDIQGIPCSREVEVEARNLGIPLTTLEEHPIIDLTFDGADEVDPELNLIKGGGGALLREKIVAQCSRFEIIIVDESKLSPALGTHWALPIEVIPFGWHSQAVFIENLGAKASLRTGTDGAPFITDHGNFILDCAFGPIADPAGLGTRLDCRTGIVCHGLFLGLADEVIVAGNDGIRYLKRENSSST